MLFLRSWIKKISDLRRVLGVQTTCGIKGKNTMVLSWEGTVCTIDPLLDLSRIFRFLRWNCDKSRQYKNGSVPHLNGLIYFVFIEKRIIFVLPLFIFFMMFCLAWDLCTVWGAETERQLRKGKTSSAIRKNPNFLNGRFAS